MLHEFLDNFTHNLFKPLLLFFYAGFLIPLLHVKLEFPKAVYQGLTIYLLLAIGWKGGEELAGLEPHLYGQAAGFMVIGLLTNSLIGIMAYYILRWTTKLRQIDAATVAGYYGSDSAGTFVTCMGVLTAGHIAFAPYMPVMLAVMEIPGCLVALYLVAGMRRRGMDAMGNMPGEIGYGQLKKVVRPASRHLQKAEVNDHYEEVLDEYSEEEYATVGAEQVKVHSAIKQTTVTRYSSGTDGRVGRAVETGGSQQCCSTGPASEEEAADEAEATLALQEVDLHPEGTHPERTGRGSFLNAELLHEVFLNPGIFLLFAGIAIGFISRLQGEKVTAMDDALFVNLFHGLLCVFLLEMGMTASKKLKDLKNAGWQFVAFALIAPNVFAVSGMLIAHGYSLFLGQQLELGTYVLFAVLCGAASYIALPAVQRLAIPEASPTLPLAASLGVTFSYNVTVGIPLYMMFATILTKYAPIASTVAHTAA